MCNKIKSLEVVGVYGRPRPGHPDYHVCHYLFKTYIGTKDSQERIFVCRCGDEITVIGNVNGRVEEIGTWIRDIKYSGRDINYYE